MELIERNHCAVTLEKDLEHLHTFREFPVFMGCTAQPAELDLKADMEWQISLHSGSVQLKKLLPLEVLYPDSHGAGCVGRLWDRHHSAFAQALSRVAPKSVFEIGGAHGILATKYRQHGEVPWTILEPNPSPVQGCPARFIKGFFDERFSCSDSFDVVVHSHLFEHVYHPAEFMRHLGSFVPEGKHLVFSLPNMQAMLERKYTNCINFEHTVLLTEPHIEFLLSQNGFRTVAREYFLEDHSIFYAAVRDGGVAAASLPRGLYSRYRELYLEYLRYHKQLIEKLNRDIRDCGRPVYLFGAHVFSQYLIAFGLDTGPIVSLLDNDPNKQGKRLYGTPLQVSSPKALEGVENPLVILKAGVYNEEVRQDILTNINPGTRFLE